MHQARLQIKEEGAPLINEKVLRGITNLPVLPAIWQRLLTCLEDPWSSLGEMEDLIRQEQGLSTRVLARANGSYYGLSGQVTNVQKALQVLGLQEVRGLCMGQGLEHLMRGSKLYKQAEGRLLWRHGLAVAEAASLLAQALTRPDRETAFAAGLLHDLGKVLLAACFPLAYQSVRQVQQRQGVSWLEAEQAQDLDHQFLGCFLAQRWGLPPMLAEVMGQHHQPQAPAEQGDLVALVHLADGLANALDQPQAQPGAGGPEAWAYCLARLRVDPEALADCGQRLAERLAAWPQL